jgi:hypothetical protein
VNAITSGDKNIVEAELNQFREYFKPRVIKKGDGKYLDRITSALTAVLHIYHSHYEAWSGAQLSKFWCNVIGYLQRRLSACYAQAHCQGLYHIAYGQRDLRRDLKLNNGSYYFAAPISSRQRLGFDFGVLSYIHVEYRNTYRPPSSRACQEHDDAFRSYVAQTQRSFDDMLDSLQRRRLTL